MQYSKQPLRAVLYTRSRQRFAPGNETPSPEGCPGSVIPDNKSDSLPVCQGFFLIKISVGACKIKKISRGVGDYTNDLLLYFYNSACKINSP
jgi:hypothetical protein